MPDQIAELPGRADRLDPHHGQRESARCVRPRQRGGHPGDPEAPLHPRHRRRRNWRKSPTSSNSISIPEPIKPTEFRLYSERVIHGEIYKARPEVNAVVHHHAHAVLPYAISGREMVPVFHLGAVIGQVPFWDQRDEFGDTNMLVIKPRKARRSPARSVPIGWC